MNRPVFTVAQNTYMEMIRDRVLYFVLIFSILFMLLGFALGQLSYKEIFRLSISFGLSGIHICFMGLTIFLSCSVFFREIEKKTIYTLLARPITRGQYLLGKYLGLFGVLGTLLVGFMFGFTLIEFLLGIPILWTSYYAFIGFILESMILLSASFFFSSFSGPFLSISGSLVFFLIGHWVSSLEHLAQGQVSMAFRLFAQGIPRFFPDLEALNWRSFAIAKAHVSGLELISAMGLTCLWAIFFFMLAFLIFRKRDFE